MRGVVKYIHRPTAFFAAACVICSSNTNRTTDFALHAAKSRGGKLKQHRIQLGGSLTEKWTQEFAVQLL